MDTSEILQENVEILKKLCKEGLLGNYRVKLSDIAIFLTNRCNNYCIMCHACSKEYENHTYNNKTPFDLTLKQYKKIISPSNKVKWQIINRKKYNENIHFHFSSAESLLNPNIFEICKYTKELYPNSIISLISNGTIPPKNRNIVKYINRIGFSVDGCTDTTYNTLRTPAKLNHAINVIKKWDKAASAYNDKFTFGFGVVLSSVNIHELSGIIKLASTFDHIDSIYVQPVIIHKSKKNLEYLLLNNIETSDFNKYIDEAKAASVETGIRIDGLKSIESTIAFDGGGYNSLFDYNKSRYCRYMSNGSISLTETGSLRYLCCYMSSDKMRH